MNPVCKHMELHWWKYSRAVEIYWISNYACTEVSLRRWRPQWAAVAPVSGTTSCTELRPKTDFIYYSLFIHINIRPQNNLHWLLYYKSDMTGWRINYYPLLKGQSRTAWKLINWWSPRTQTEMTKENKIEHSPGLKNYIPPAVALCQQWTLRQPRKLFCCAPRRWQIDAAGMEQIEFKTMHNTSTHQISGFKIFLFVDRFAQYVPQSLTLF